MAAVIPFLIIFPLIVACLMFAIRNNKVRNIVAYSGSVIIMIAVAILVIAWFQNGAVPVELFIETAMADKAIIAAELALMVLVTFLCIKHKRVWVSFLSIVPTLMMVYLELFGPELTETAHITLDHLSILMCVIIGLIGGLIIIYAVGYMHGFAHHHTEFADRRYYFFMLLFAFLGAMFGFVTSRSLLWIDFFWETTSVISFLLIGYTKTKEAIRNSFRALWMNLLGGLALAIGIFYYAYKAGTVDIQHLVFQGSVGANMALLPVALIAFAALTKAAQLPFSTWLLGAMVAPTPSSALLHSATMVKAGIYILFRLSPALSGRLSGTMVAFIGGFTFLAASIMAIAQSDAKKVLAMSTIANLGLMVACAGVGTAETIWAGIFLMLFHAVSKSMLFQAVGATENALHSRDIEAFHGLIYRLPFLAMIQFIGIAGMFLAPFGMLISKWAALKASVDEGNILLVFLIVFGSSITSFYWTKWMGKLIAQTRDPKVKDITKKNEVISLVIHAVLMVGLCVLFPLLSGVYVDPLLKELFGHATQVLPTTTLITLIIVILFIFGVPALSFLYGENTKTNIKMNYMSGINDGTDYGFIDSYGDVKQLQVSNYYFATTIGSRKIMLPCQIVAMVAIIGILCMILGGVL